MSDTYLLQRDGWDFHAEEHYEPHWNAHAIRLAVTSPDKAMAISGVMRISAAELMDSYSYRRFTEMPFQMQQYSCKDVFRTAHHAEVDSWSALAPVDLTVPTFASDRQICFRDFKIFQPVEGARNEIFIPEGSVDELFNQILKIQYPQQQEIKKGLIMPEAKPIIQAQIFSLAA